MRCRTLCAVGFLHWIVQHCCASTLRGSSQRSRGGPEASSKPQEQEPLWKLVDLPIRASASEDSKIFVNDPSKVDPLIGTGGHGHTYPGATTPWGMIQATPWTRSPDLDDWDMQSGFNSDATTMHFHGMAHTALSGAGWGEMGEVRLLPRTMQPQGPVAPPMFLVKGDTEVSPGFFSTTVTQFPENPGADRITIESSATPRGAIHRFTFADSFHAPNIVSLELGPVMGEGTNPSPAILYYLADHNLTITGRGAEGCVMDTSSISGAISILCFALEFSRAPLATTRDDGTAMPRSVGMIFSFDPRPMLVARIGFSRTDVEHAREALREVADEFQDVVAAARSSWEDALGVIKVAIEPEWRKRMFYTALYHTMVAPNLHSDSDGTFRLEMWTTGVPPVAKNPNFFNLSTIDVGVPRHRSESERGQYVTFSFWDTYRSLHPLLNLVHPEQSKAFAESLLAFARHWRALPEYQLLASPAHIMVGDGASIVLGTMARNHIIDQEKAFEVLDRGRHVPIDERQYLDTTGRVPNVRHQVSIALEQAAADACVARLAKDLGKVEKAKEYKNRSNLVLRHWDARQDIFAPSVAQRGVPMPDPPMFVLGRVPDINTVTSNSYYTEGTALQYSFGAPFMVPGMVALRGGVDKFVEKLDYFFNRAPEPSGVVDITGNFHGMTVGNEPSMHIPYLYAAVGHAEKTQEIVDTLVNSFFSSRVNGLPGNDDMGQMSSWLVLNILGFYPMDACSGEFVFGRPFVNHAELTVPGGKLMILVNGQGDLNKYVERLMWKGQPVDMRRPVLSFDELAGGGILEFWMTDKSPAAKQDTDVAADSPAGTGPAADSPAGA